MTRGMYQRRPWSESDLEYIRINYRRENGICGRLAERLSRTDESVRYQLEKLGMLPEVKFRPWSKHDDERLEEMSGKRSVKKIAKSMSRTENAITNRMKKLGISRRSRDGWYTAKDVSYMFGVSRHWVEHRIRSGRLVAERHNGSGIQGSSYWRISEGELRKYLTKCASELDGFVVDVWAIVHLFVDGSDCS